MLIQAAKLRVGDVIQETGHRGRIFRTRVQTLRKGGHIPQRYRRPEVGLTIPIAVSPTPTRLQPYSSIVVNEEWVFPWTAWITVLRGENEMERVAEGTKAPDEG